MHCPYEGELTMLLFKRAVVVVSPALVLLALGCRWQSSTSTTLPTGEMDSIDCGTDAGTAHYGLAKRYNYLGEGNHTIVLTHSGGHVAGRPRSAAAGPAEPNGYYIVLDGFRVPQRAH
jgi:hypothetical protein